MKKLKKILDRFYREYDFEGRILHDPIQFPLGYENPRDIEVSAFMASCLAYGRVDQFRSVIKELLSRMGGSPYAFIADFKVRKHRKHLEGIKYRFNENEDIVSMVYLLHRILSRYSSIEHAFQQHYQKHHTTIEQGLSGLIGMFLETDTSPVYEEDIKPRGLLHLFPSPLNRSSCKRANLFLRWMIRDDDIDLGIWEKVSKNQLVIPLDTHIARISSCLGLTERCNQDWKTAVEITESFKKFDPEDPLKYDFALCHHGISGLCRDNSGNEACKECHFRDFSRI